MSKNQNIGVMGGSFNPFHFAHLNSLLTVREAFSLKKIIVIPSFQTPLREKEEITPPLSRWEMLQRALFPYSFMEVDDQEIRRKGISYTYQTITQLLKTDPKLNLFFIIGMDQFHIFERWKNWPDILKKTNLIVTSRPGALFPKTRADLPKGLQPLIFPAGVKDENLEALVREKEPKELSLILTEKKIYFCRLKDMDISAEDIRQRIKEGKEVGHLVPESVDTYIKEHNLYVAPKEGRKS